VKIEFSNIEMVYRFVEMSTKAEFSGAEARLARHVIGGIGNGVPPIGNGVPPIADRGRTPRLNLRLSLIAAPVLPCSSGNRLAGRLGNPGGKNFPPRQHRPPWKR
jgi:hypothetical protein